MANNGSIVTDKIQLRWVEVRLPLGWVGEVYVCMVMDKHQYSF